MASRSLLVMASIAALPINAHMLMNLPTPFSPDKMMTWPVEAPGGRFPYPCQGWTDVAHRTVVTAGSTTLVNFTGSAPHGGGSCQFGINYEGLPAYSTDPTDWRTIYTIIGGCPAEIKSTPGNLEEDPYFRGYGDRQIPDAVHCGDDKGVDCIRQFEIPIPKDLPNGDATFAWTWYNRITQNELYMMCAPITVTGGVEDEAAGSKFVDELPVMFLANIPGFTNCSTSRTGEQGVFNIPNPGRYGVQLIEPDPNAAGDCPIAPPPVFEGPANNPNIPAIPASTAPRLTNAPATASSPTNLPASSGMSFPAHNGTRHTSTAFVTVTGGGVVTVTETVIVTAAVPTPAVSATPIVTTATGTTGTAKESETPAAGEPYPCAINGAVVCITERFFGGRADSV
ncbi:uncharacterized protein B0H64DRAFT_431369 [Chaetomium fimeti]|uniref:Lytic polysaccharide monooxygenase n=1 Tax=Chaetomium fimeti TaxID=1854472 RepID=A0AAE0HJ78_9PEZI|nr:hypothetical protein B0H64DRAFT_431369 [Chaetomium fimeti]